MSELMLKKIPLSAYKILRQCYHGAITDNGLGIIGRDGRIGVINIRRIE